jgi:hypothetical protein
VARVLDIEGVFELGVAGGHEPVELRLARLKEAPVAEELLKGGEHPASIQWVGCIELASGREQGAKWSVVPYAQELGELDGPVSFNRIEPAGVAKRVGKDDHAFDRRDGGKLRDLRFDQRCQDFGVLSDLVRR